MLFIREDIPLPMGQTSPIFTLLMASFHKKLGRIEDFAGEINQTMISVQTSANIV